MKDLECKQCGKLYPPDQLTRVDGGVIPIWRPGPKSPSGWRGAWSGKRGFIPITTRVCDRCLGHAPQVFAEPVVSSKRYYPAAR